MVEVMAIDVRNETYVSDTEPHYPAAAPNVCDGQYFISMFWV